MYWHRNPGIEIFIIYMHDECPPEFCFRSKDPALAEWCRI